MHLSAVRKTSIDARESRHHKLLAHGEVVSLTFRAEDGEQSTFTAAEWELCLDGVQVS